MHLSSDYDVYIFDCDGVILDSNNLKLDAMEIALSSYPPTIVQNCLDYFSKNFGRSRYLHVEYFLTEIIHCAPEIYQNTYDSIIEKYASLCVQLYKEAEINAGFIDFIQQVKSDKFVASGSDEKELRQVFSERGLSKYFVSIYGSPNSKSNNINKILTRGYKKGVMFGDALGDLAAADKNNIDFIFVSDLSTAPELVRNAAMFQGTEIKNFSNLL